MAPCQYQTHLCRRRAPRRMGRADLHDRKARKVSNVMGCELRRQLSEPGAGDCWWSMTASQLRRRRQAFDQCI